MLVEPAPNDLPPVKHGDVTPVSANELVAALVEAPMSPATRRAYAADWVRFSGWCAQRDVDAVRPGEGAVATYVAEASVSVDAVGGWVVAASTLQRWVSGSIRFMLLPVGWCRDARSWCLALLLASGVARATPAKRRRPLRVEELRRIVRSVRMDTAGWTDDIRAARDAFLLLAGYFGAFRSAELVALTVADVTLEQDGLGVAVRRSKTDQLAVGTTKGLPRTTAADLCPVCAWVRWRGLIDAHDAGGRPAVIVQLENADRIESEQGHVCLKDALPAVRSDRVLLIRRLGSAGWRRTR